VIGSGGKTNGLPESGGARSQSCASGVGNITEGTRERERERVIQRERAMERGQEKEKGARGEERERGSERDG
jgi:hypothetical protein